MVGLFDYCFLALLIGILLTNVHHYHFLASKVWLVTIFLSPLILNCEVELRQPIRVLHHPGLPMRDQSCEMHGAVIRAITREMDQIEFVSQGSGRAGALRGATSHHMLSLSHSPPSPYIQLHSIKQSDLT